MIPSHVKTRHGYDLPLCFLHELLMSLINMDIQTYIYLYIGFATYCISVIVLESYFPVSKNS